MSWQYRIEGSDLQYVELTLSPGDSVIGEPGAMMYVDEGVSIETHMGDEQIGGTCEQLRVRVLEGLADGDRRNRLQRVFHIAQPSRIGIDEEDVLARRRDHRRPLTHQAPRWSRTQLTVVECGHYTIFRRRGEPVHRKRSLHSVRRLIRRWGGSWLVV